MGKYCPICDGEVEGRYCKGCKKFIKPYVMNSNMHLNSGHDANETSCDYHGVGEEHSSGNYRPSDSGMGSGNNNAGILIFVIAFIVIIVSAVTVYFTATKQNEKESKDVEDEVISIDESGNQTGQTKPWDIFTDALSDEELAKKREEGGFDENGYRNMTLEEVKKGGEPGNWATSFGESHTSTTRHIASALEKENIYFFDLGESDESNNYQYFDDYGMIWKYYISYDDMLIYENEDDEEYSGFITTYYDTYSGDTDMIEVVHLKSIPKLSKLLQIILPVLDGVKDPKCDINYEVTTKVLNSGEFEYGDLTIYLSNSENSETGAISYSAEIYKE